MQYSDGFIKRHRTSKEKDTWKWQGIIYAIDDAGKRKQLSRVFDIPCDAPTEKEKGRGAKSNPTGKGARRALDSLRAWREELIEADNKKTALGDVSADTLTVPQFVESYWKTRQLEPETAHNYKSILAHIDCPILQIPISQLDPLTVDRWLTFLRDEKQLGQQMLNKTFNQVKYACEYAIELGILAQQPCIKRITPKRPRTQINALDDAALAALNAHVTKLRERNERLADIITFALNTGMRLGEICALKFSDVDGYRDGKFVGSIHVNNNLTRSGRIKPYPKNGQRRDIPVNTTLRALLQHRREAYLPLVKDLRSVYVFSVARTPETAPSSSTIGRMFSDTVAGWDDVSGIITDDKLSFHDLRHTFATQALAHGIDLANVSSILGHENSTTTLRYYARWMPSKRDEAMNALDSVMNKSHD